MWFLTWLMWTSFVRELNTAYLARQIFWNSFWVAKSYTTFRCTFSFEDGDFLNMDRPISQVSVVTWSECGGIFKQDYSKFTAESSSEGIFKIGKHFVKLRTRLQYLFFDSQCIWRLDEYSGRLCVNNGTIRGAVLTCARKPTWVSLVYQAECLPYSILLPVYSERLHWTGWRNLLLSRHINNEFVPVHAFSEGMITGPGRAFSCVELMPRPSIDSAERRRTCLQPIPLLHLAVHSVHACENS